MIWGVNIIEAGEDKFLVEFLAYTSRPTPGKAGSNKSSLTIAHHKKFLTFKQLCSFCRRHKVPLKYERAI